MKKRRWSGRSVPFCCSHRVWKQKVVLIQRYQTFQIGRNKRDKFSRKRQSAASNMARKWRTKSESKAKHRFYPVAVHLNRKSIITKLYVTRSQYCSSIHKNNRCAPSLLRCNKRTVIILFSVNLCATFTGIISQSAASTFVFDETGRSIGISENRNGKKNTHTIFPADIFVLIDLWIGFYLLSCLLPL